MPDEKAGGTHSTPPGPREGEARCGETFNSAADLEAPIVTTRCGEPAIFRCARHAPLPAQPSSQDAVDLDEAHNRIAHRQADIEALIAAETELECISDVATGARPAGDFQPAHGTLGEVILALARRAPAPSQEVGAPADRNGTARHDKCGGWYLEPWVLACRCRDPYKDAEAAPASPASPDAPVKGKEG